jgi:hypothetical protein
MATFWEENQALLKDNRVSQSAYYEPGVKEQRSQRPKHSSYVKPSFRRA